MVRHLGSLSELAVMTAETDFDFIGVSATTREYLDAVQILNYLKRERSCATVAIGGPHATALPEECLRNGFDLVVVGEADDVIADLVERRSEQPSIFRCGFVRDLDHLPLPDLQLLDDRDAWLPFLYLGQEPRAPHDLDPAVARMPLSLSFLRPPFPPPAPVEPGHRS